MGADDQALSNYSWIYINLLVGNWNFTAFIQSCYTEKPLFFSKSHSQVIFSDTKETYRKSKKRIV